MYVFIELYKTATLDSRAYEKCEIPKERTQEDDVLHLWDRYVSVHRRERKEDEEEDHSKEKLMEVYVLRNKRYWYALWSHLMIGIVLL